MSHQKTISAHVLTESGYRVQKQGSQALILNSVLINLNRFFFHYFFPRNKPVPWQGMPQLNHTLPEKICSISPSLLHTHHDFSLKCSLKCLFQDWSVHIHLILSCAAAAVPYHPSGIFSEPFPGPLKPFERGGQAPDTIFKQQVQNAFLQWHYDDFCLVFYSLLNNP